MMTSAALADRQNSGARSVDDELADMDRAIEEAASQIEVCIKWKLEVNLSLTTLELIIYCYTYLIALKWNNTNTSSKLL